MCSVSNFRVVDLSLLQWFSLEFLYSQQIKFKSQLEQQRLQLQREHSSEMEQILEKVSPENYSIVFVCSTSMSYNRFS